MSERRLRIAVVIGTRPESIKLAPVVKELRRRPDDVEPLVVVTAQHREMTDQVLQLFSIAPDYDLDIMRSGQSLFDVTQRALSGLRPILEQERPDFLVVQGDTTTVLVGALAAFYLKIPIGHVEAGLRTHDKHHPFPEEVNRRLASVLADLHFAPTEAAKQNLLREGIPAEQVYVTGNTVVDALLSVASDEYQFVDPALQEIDFEKNRILLVTAHRRENWGTAMQSICRSLHRIVAAHSDVHVIFSVHPNPAVRKIVMFELERAHRTLLLKPVDYQAFVHLMAKSYLILTDSGGIQEEAPSLGKPTLVLRGVTERPEGIEAGTLKVVGVDEDNIVKEVERLLNDKAAYDAATPRSNPYGDGQASRRIVDAILARKWSIGG